MKKYHPNDENSTENHPNLTTTTSTTTVKTENTNLTNNTIVTSTTENIKSELELKLHESASAGIITSSTTALVNTNFPNKTISRVTGTNQHVIYEAFIFTVVAKRNIMSTVLLSKSAIFRWVWHL